ncbi:hypothetical protein SEPCBS57363_001481 [Sporothrix epigloea]|uniref:Zn(2)-C6 fungal-type domain-containing protein n=1 Tax=Sporothrix epigloea TaxID=1892477 RepID=A0ABP0DAI9_9PEZI
MAGLADDLGTKRKRVFRACDSCRLMKSKCDGIRPACSRCIGYGHKCVYALTGKRRDRHQFLVADVSATALQTAVNEYDRLVREILSKLPAAERPVVEDDLQKIADHLQQVRPDAPACEDRAQSQAQAQAQATLPQSGSTATRPREVPRKRPSVSTASVPRTAERYLGEVSDVRFFNLVDRALAGTGSRGTPAGSLPDEPMLDPASTETDVAMTSYEQDDFSPESTAAHSDIPANFPDSATAQRFLDIYFSTIHVAYPFLPRALFMQTYRAYMASGRQIVPHNTWLATLYILLAIGAYYHAASGGAAATQANCEASTQHQRFYRKAMSLVNGSEALERSLNQVSFLLAQCFYLLAVCRTDACWTTLGLAVRIGQSIGLHVDADTARSGPRPKSRQVQMLAFCNAELRRRVWYSIYVLDRLLALQLGRPPAIHDEDSQLRLPSRLGDEDIQWLSGADSQINDTSAPLELPLDPATPTVGDYFLCMISLSRIIGHVLRDLYSPRSSGNGNNDHDDTVDTLTDWLLPSTKKLDRQLLAWRRTLPRKLRFDFGHAFDNTSASSSAAIFKRQRNMLAIKFHHLRAVIHRPYLCLPLLWRLREDGSGDEADSVARAVYNGSPLRNKMVGRYEKICILEVQATAHLLHNVVDKKNLVHDFPWWQMISCLVYASSILVVASAFVARHQPGGDAATELAVAGDRDEIDGADSDIDDGDAIDAAALEDDAETCLTVFEALSLNSESARLARNMMRRLKARGAAWREAHTHTTQKAAMPITAASEVNMANVASEPSLPGRETGQAVSSLLLPYSGQRIEPTEGTFFANAQPVQPDNFASMPVQTPTPVVWPVLQEWPLEILDSMEWSTQFFNTTDGAM